MAAADDDDDDDDDDILTVQFVGRRQVQFLAWAVDSMFGFQGACFKMNFSDRQEGSMVLDVLSNYPLLSQR